MSEVTPSKTVKNVAEPKWSPQGGGGWPICDCMEGPGCLWEKHHQLLVL